MFRLGEGKVEDFDATLNVFDFEPNSFGTHEFMVCVAIFLRIVDERGSRRNRNSKFDFKERLYGSTIRWI